MFATEAFSFSAASRQGLSSAPKDRIATLLPRLVSLLGTGNDEAKTVLAALGWRLVEVADAPSVWRRLKKKETRRRTPDKPPPENSPFAGLKELLVR